LQPKKLNPYESDNPLLFACAGISCAAQEHFCPRGLLVVLTVLLIGYATVNKLFHEPTLRKSAISKRNVDAISPFGFVQRRF